MILFNDFLINPALASFITALSSPRRFLYQPILFSLSVPLLFHHGYVLFLVSRNRMVKKTIIDDRRRVVPRAVREYIRYVCCCRYEDEADAMTCCCVWIFRI